MSASRLTRDNKPNRSPLRKSQEDPGAGRELVISDFTCCFSHRSRAPGNLYLAGGLDTFPQSVVISSENARLLQLHSLAVRNRGWVRAQTGMQVLASNDLGSGPCRARVLIMFFQNKWAFRWARRWRRFHGVPRNHGNPVTPLSGHGVSLPGAEGISGRSRRREKAVTLPSSSLARSTIRTCSSPRPLLKFWKTAA